jgi:putative CocE/NonD family hydrolase
MTKDYWEFEHRWKDIAATTCSMTSWWDRQAGTVDQYVGMRRSGPGATRDQHRLMIGPWSHNTYFMKRKLGPRDYGAQAEGVFADVVRHWFDARLKGVDNGLDAEPPVRLFLLNDNRWVHAQDWPVPGTEFRQLFLHSQGHANTTRGDGTLSFDAPKANEPPDRYDYDPADPVMSLMGADTQHAPCDQSPLDGRRDILVYQSEPLAEELLVVGPVTLMLHAATDAPDTDFAVKLIEVGADGIAINLSFGIVRARYRGGPGTDAPMVKNEPHAFAIELMPVGIRFRKGSRIRLDVASSDFPNFDRNHNTIADYWADGELRVARQTVFHDKARPSHLVLPVVSEKMLSPASWVAE